jgi:diketogulonate reductase-like aldo/keto reductase
LLTANRAQLGHPFIQVLAQKYSKTEAQIIFRFSHQIGMIPLTGSSSATHLKEDLDVFHFELTAAEMNSIEKLN